ncbi:MAG TPA: hypothetical protein VFZ68_15870 [Acidimicrobiales bacterium]
MARLAIETWAPDYGAPVEAGVLDESTATVALDVERPAASWAPVAPAADPAGAVLFVDGVQRIDARVWVTDDGGPSRVGVCATWGAGAVRCAGRARYIGGEVRRGVLCPGDPVDPIVTRHGTYEPYPVPGAEGDPVHQAVGRARGDLEGRVAVSVRPGGEPGELLIVDGPLGDRRHIAGAVGYVKSHQLSYLPPEQQHVITTLGPGQRTPLFTVGDRRYRYSWYLRLPGRATHPWWGVVRCEAAGDLGRAEATALADRVAATVPRFATQPHNDPRAPQNLHPIAGLERELRRRLGDQPLLERALREAAADGGGDRDGAGG